MTGAMLKRYVALRYLANSKRRNEFQATLRELERLDGISPRRAHEAHAMLAEMRLITIERERKPYRYVLLLPSEWKPAPRRTKGEREVITGSLGPVPWK
jgi:hypothetical protein